MTTTLQHLAFGLGAPLWSGAQAYPPASVTGIVLAKPVWAAYALALGE